MHIQGLCLALLLPIGLPACGNAPLPAPMSEAVPLAAPAPPAPLPEAAPQFGQASFYAPHFAGRRTASGARFDPNAAVMAHRHLPFGSQARVTNLMNGRSAIVRVADRGPYVQGRIADVSPAVARRLGMTDRGLVPVMVQPLSLEEVAEAPERRGDAASSP
jgi:rare lipoprotein A